MCEAKRIWQTGYAVHESHCVGHDCATGHRKCVFERFYLVREVIAFVAFTALLVFFLASPVVLGTMVPSSSRTVLPAYQRARSGIASKDFVESRPTFYRGTYEREERLEA